MSLCTTMNWSVQCIPIEFLIQKGISECSKQRSLVAYCDVV